MQTDDTIGARLKAIRHRRGMSQRQLARQSGVANATISLIENGKLNPTVSMLKKVLDGIPIHLSEFFSDAEEPPEKVFFKHNELTEIVEGGVSYRQVGANLSTKAIQFLKESYAPGSNTGRHEISHEGEECGIILSGRLTVTVNGETMTLIPGDAYYFRSDLPHSFSNTGTEPCELITACSPPSF
ncbi:MAG: cupin domain-containing protein [Pseudomonadales bacterium]|nr:cupin domain-containing protein [Pseudomonadales bacterium]MBO6566063.1 cupin domain-containing protein [Pseudomonadales bacterium]MBO6597147.1 cupin domain-containing protein [Pseudomonadales bacterium]MBO6655346.1 cupin domain-containing protein [Pseudomonadales bacterium]MBO6703778.1 cupin domain-containing protein [Pseudomonadales bacterium]